MDTLTEHEMEVIVQRLETLVTDLEHDGSTPTFYAFVLLAQEFAGTKKAPFTLTHIRRCLVLAHRVRAIRDRLVSAGGRWTPMHDVGEVLHAEATRLSSLYGVARPACRTARRALQQAFRVAFTQATGKAYQKYGLPLTATERTTITAWWDEALHTALAWFQARGEVEALDQVMACLPVWADRHHERWSRQGWREPSATEVLALFTDYLRVCETCLGTVIQIVRAAVAHAPVVESGPGRAGRRAAVHCPGRRPPRPAQRPPVAQGHSQSAARPAAERARPAATAAPGPPEGARGRDHAPHEESCQCAAQARDACEDGERVSGQPAAHRRESECGCAPAYDLDLRV